MEALIAAIEEMPKCSSIRAIYFPLEESDHVMGDPGVYLTGASKCLKCGYSEAPQEMIEKHFATPGDPYYTPPAQPKHKYAPHSAGYTDYERFARDGIVLPPPAKE